MFRARPGPRQPVSQKNVDGTVVWTLRALAGNCLAAGALLGLLALAEPPGKSHVNRTRAPGTTLENCLLTAKTVLCPRQDSNLRHRL